MPIPLTAPSLDHDDVGAVARAVLNVGGDGHRRQLEQFFADYAGTAGAVATNSCTSAIVLGLRALRVGSGDEVAIPTYTCLAVLNAVAQVGATPRLMDCAYEPRRMDFNVTPDSAALARTPRLRAAIVPHMFGVVADISGIRRALDVPVIEDVTLALGARHEGRNVGGQGEIAVSSFHASKMIASGEGGILTARDEQLLERARTLNGWQAEQAADRLRTSGFAYTEARYNFNLSELGAALALSQFQKLSRFIERRHHIAARYDEWLRHAPRILLPRLDAGGGVYFRYLVAVEVDVPTVLSDMAEAGIEAGRGVYPSLHDFLGEPAARFPNAVRAAGSLVSIPIYPALSDADVDTVGRAAARVLGGEAS